MCYRDLRKDGWPAPSLADMEAAAAAVHPLAWPNPLPEPPATRRRSIVPTIPPKEIPHV